MYFLVDFVNFLFYVPIGVAEGCVQILWFLVYLTMFFFSLFLITIEDSIYCVLFLIGIFLGAAFLLLILKTEFLAFMFLIVYVGAIAVFFLFIVMMINFKLQIKLNMGEVLTGFFFLSIFFLISIYLLPINRVESFIFSDNFAEKLNYNFNLSRPLNAYRLPFSLTNIVPWDYSKEYPDYIVNWKLLKTPNLFVSSNFSALSSFLPSKSVVLNRFNDFNVLGSVLSGKHTIINDFSNRYELLLDTIQFSYNFNNLRLVENFKTYEGINAETFITPSNFTNIRQIGLFLYTYDLIAFLLCGFVLLVAILGCVILTVEVKLVGHKKQRLTDQLLKRYVQVGYYFSNN
jgi:NADH:ubiquinone oxidoreductase subunit 6 (subunit J)